MIKTVATKRRIQLSRTRLIAMALAAVVMCHQVSTVIVIMTTMLVIMVGQQQLVAVVSLGKHLFNACIQLIVH